MAFQWTINNGTSTNTMECAHDSFGAVIVGIFFGSVAVILLILGVIFLLHQRYILPERERKGMEGLSSKTQGSVLVYEHGQSTMSWYYIAKTSSTISKVLQSLDVPAGGMVVTISYTVSATHTFF